MLATLSFNCFIQKLKIALILIFSILVMSSWFFKTSQALEKESYKEIPELSVEIDGELLPLEHPPKMISNRIMLPARPVLDGFGAEMDWDGDDRLIYGISDDVRVVMSPDHNEAIIDGNSEELDVTPEIIDGRTYIPFRFAGEAFGGYVEYRGEQDTVEINFKDEEKSKENETDDKEKEETADPEDADPEDAVEDFNDVVPDSFPDISPDRSLDESPVEKPEQPDRPSIPDIHKN